MMKLTTGKQKFWETKEKQQQHMKSESLIFITFIVFWLSTS